MKMMLVPFMDWGQPIKQNKNRAVLTRLFQGYVNDYGNTAGEKIIWTIIDELGGMRLRFGGRLYADESLKSLNYLYARLKNEFGHTAGHAIMQKFVIELKGLRRVSIPTFKYLAIMERNKKIKDYPGSNKEAAILWDIAESQVSRIRNGE